jgi:hypothetical protein
MFQSRSSSDSTLKKIEWLGDSPLSVGARSRTHSHDESPVEGDCRELKLPFGSTYDDYRSRGAGTSTRAPSPDDGSRNLISGSRANADLRKWFTASHNRQRWLDLGALMYGD